MNLDITAVLHIIFGPVGLTVGLLVGCVDIWRFRRWLKTTRKHPDLWGFRLGRFDRWEEARRAGAGFHIWWNLIFLVVAIGLSILSYVLAPKPKAPKPDSVQDLKDPVAEAGMPIPVVFGTITVKGLNCLWYGDKHVKRYKVKA